MIIIPLTLLAIAFFCFGSWACGFYRLTQHRKAGTLDRAEFKFYDENMFRLGLCGIIALGFAGMILTQ